MINRTHALPAARQCQVLKLARSTAYYQPKPAVYRMLRTSQHHPAHRIYPLSTMPADDHTAEPRVGR